MELKGLPGTILWPLEERQKFPLRTPNWTENVQAVCEGGDPLPPQVTGALTITLILGSQARASG